VTTSGYSPAAKKRLQQERGARAEVVTLQELDEWSPKGTIHVSFRVPASGANRAAKLLRALGTRVRLDTQLERSAHEVVLVAFGLFGTGSAEEQRAI
jgi:hypothetical protein